MGHAEIICQPFGAPPIRHRDALVSLLNLKGATEVTIISAFVLDAGVFELEPMLTASAAHKLAVVGIDNGVTSFQGLARLLGCVTELWVIKGLVGRSIMHSKVLMSVAPVTAIALVGSANLTFPGLYNNVETSVQLELATQDANDSQIIDQIHDLRTQLIGAGGPFSIQVTSVQDLRGLLGNGQIADETVAVPATATGAAAGGLDSNRLGEADLPYPLAGRRRRAAGANAIAASGIGQLLWRKVNVPNSDAQVVVVGTHPTGVLRFSQAQFAGPSGLIDNKTYFRNDVFAAARWRRSGGKEETVIPFRIRSRSRDLGSFRLKVSHAPHRQAGQGNVPTLLHWGDALQAIINANVAGLTLSLYGPDSAGAFTILFA